MLVRNINVICIPFAGGNKYSLRQVFHTTPGFMNVITLELPGRGRRVGEPLLMDVEMMVDDLYSQVLPYIESGYILYGHSMGALLAFLLTRKIIREHNYPPLNLFVSGFAGPSIRQDSEQHKLPKGEFLKMLRDLGGLPDELLSDEKLLDFYYPIIRADFKAIETYRYEVDEPLPVPIFVMAGSHEDISDEEMEAWAGETRFPLSTRRFYGRHFFIFEHADSIIEVILKHANIPAAFEPKK